MDVHSSGLKAASVPDPTGRVQWLLGLLLGLGLLKFGNPVILDRLVETPRAVAEWIFFAWPVRWGQWLLAPLAVWALARAAAPPGPWPRAVWALAVWFVWQFLSLFTSIHPGLSRVTVIHFAACLACFAIGFVALRPAPHLHRFGLVMAPFFAWMVWTGWEQHFGGLEATERMIQSVPGWQDQYPKEYLDRMAKRRVFANFVSPNAFAGALLLLLPLVTHSLVNGATRLTPPSRRVISGTLAAASIGCLFWTGSKSGWLIALVLLAVTAMRFIPWRKARWLAAGAVGVAGVAGFLVTFAPYFRAGATSLSARADYWRAATSTALGNPWLGTGPGTFGKAYAEVRHPDSEMTHLAHNDYLEQASDSGWVAFLCYLAFWLAVLLGSARSVLTGGDRGRFVVWLGLLGWCLQGVSEYHLYVPALSWPAFFLAGWLLARQSASTAGLVSPSVVGQP